MNTLEASVRTGDTFNPVIIIAIAAACVLAVIVLSVAGKKRR